MATTASRFIAAARGEIGYTESPRNSNRTKYAALAAHANGQPWCATFLVALARQLGQPLPNESAYTPTLANGFKFDRRWSPEPKLGAFAFFNFPGDGKDRIQHVGVVVSWSGRLVTCIEGNTSPGSGGSQDNGGGVYMRTRPRSHVVGYGHVAYAPDTPAHTEVTGVKLTKYTVSAPKVGADGKGYVSTPHAFERVVSVQPNGPWPPRDGYWPVAQVAPHNEGGKLVIVFGGVPNFAPSFYVSVLED